MSKAPSIQRVEYILSQCEGKRVLHLGCTNWPYTDDSIASGSLLHSLMRDRCSELFGIDADEAGLNLMRQSGFENLYAANLESLETCKLKEAFDVVVAGEMIEHLNNPGLFLGGVKRFLGPESTLLITTVNAYCFARALLYAFKGKGGENEPVHPDHVAYYSYSTLRLLLNRHGFADPEIIFYDIGKEHRPHNRWLVNFANDAAVRIFPQLSDGLIAKCSVKERAT
jgi:SAM-dependent methyltransferase